MITRTCARWRPRVVLKALSLRVEPPRANPQRLSRASQLLALASGSLALFLGYEAHSAFSKPSPPLPSLLPPQQRHSLSLSDIIHASKSSLVSIRLISNNILVSEQSGFVVDSTGLTITTDMDPSKFDQINIKTSDGRTFPASLLEYDTSTGLCMLKVHINDPAYFHFLPLLSKCDENIKTGDFVMTLGSGDRHFNEDFSFGIIKSYNEDDSGKKVQYFTSMAIEGSYSAGGPVFNMNGKVIGVNKTVSNCDTKSQVFIPIECGRSLLERIRQANHNIPTIARQKAYSSNHDIKLSDYKKDCFFR